MDHSSPSPNNLQLETIDSLQDGKFGRVKVQVILVLVTLLLFRFFMRSKVPKTKGKFPRVRHGPFKLPDIVEGCITMIQLKRLGLEAYATWTKKYGLIYELPFLHGKMICIQDPNKVQKFLHSSEPGHLSKPRYIYDLIFVEGLRHGLITADFPVWAPHRKMISRAFTYRALSTYLSFMNEHAKGLSQKLLSECCVLIDTKRMDKKPNFGLCGEPLFDFIHFFSLKIILQILMGADTSCSDEDAVFFHRRFRRAKDILLYRFNNGIFVLDALWSLHPKKREFAQIFKELSEFANKRIDKLKERRDWERQQGMSVKRNVEEEVEVEDEEQEDDVGQKPFRCMIEEMLHCDASNDEIFSQVATFLSAGHETMTLAIIYFMWHLAVNKEHQDLCREEIDDILDGKAGDPKDAFLNMKDLYNMKHMDRCILEAQRLTPSIPIWARRLDSPFKLDDEVELEQGENLMFTANVTHMNPEYFPNPNKFDPDRFLPENVKNRVPYTYLPFSLGPRNCIGQKLSMVQTKVIVGWVLRHFELQTKDKWEDIKWVFDVTIMPHRMLNLTIKPRNIN